MIQQHAKVLYLLRQARRLVSEPSRTWRSASQPSESLRGHILDSVLAFNTELTTLLAKSLNQTVFRNTDARFSTRPELMTYSPRPVGFMFVDTVFLLHDYPHAGLMLEVGWDPRKMSSKPKAVLQYVPAGPEEGPQSEAWIVEQEYGLDDNVQQAAAKCLKRFTGVLTEKLELMGLPEPSRRNEPRNPSSRYP